MVAMKSTGSDFLGVEIMKKKVETQTKVVTNCDDTIRRLQALIAEQAATKEVSAPNFTMP